MDYINSKFDNGIKTANNPDNEICNPIMNRLFFLHNSTQTHYKSYPY